MGASCCTAIDNHFEDKRLRDCTDKNCMKFVPQVRRGKVVSVYDGDTLTLAARHGKQGPPFLFRVRLAGIDTPELRGGSPAEKEAAIAARDWLRERVLGKCVTLEEVGLEKYGRLLARVVHKGKDVGSLLLAEGHAVPYDGGKKPAFGEAPAAGALLAPERVDVIVSP